MSDKEFDLEAMKAENEKFFEKADKAFRTLFDAAKAKNELDFAFALEPEERGYQNSGWSSAAETFIAFDEYCDFLGTGENTRFKFRVALSFYCHLSEASGFYEVPEKLLLVFEGDPSFRKAFDPIIKKHKTTGDAILPNTTAVFKALIGHAKNAGFEELAEVFKEAFDPELRNAYAHANYVLRPTEIRLKHKASNKTRVISMPEFEQIFKKGIGFFQVLRNVLKEYIASYDPVKVITGKLNPDEDEFETQFKIQFQPKDKSFSISSFNDYFRWVIDAREIFADELKDDAQDEATAVEMQ